LFSPLTLADEVRTRHEVSAISSDVTCDPRSRNSRRECESASPARL
jgi:hypothetical protein